MNPWFLLLALPPLVLAAILFYHLGRTVGERDEIRRHIEEIRSR